MRFGKIGPLGNLEKHAEAVGWTVTKFTCELAVMGLRRSLGVRDR